jgi:RIO kinase 1
MRERNSLRDWLELAEEEEMDEDRAHRLTKRLPSPGIRRSKSKRMAERAEKDEVKAEVKFTYQGARHERVWIIAALSDFVADHILTDVLHMVQGGKEATVYCCKAYPTLGVDLLAAKIYRPRMFRNLKNDALYREGREILGDDGKAVHDHRSQRAILKKTRLGSEMQITSWIEHEYQTLRTLHDAGAAVPRPVAQNGNVILMDYIGEAGSPAPTLQSVSLEPAEAGPLFDLLIENVGLMLAHNRIHADLSAYNVLYWEGQVTIIDFPQVVDPLYNPQGYRLLERDIARLCQYFSQYKIRANSAQIATDLWGHYLRGELR